MSQRTPRGMRLHLALFGRRNVGKSSLLNALTGQQVSIVSPLAGTTTDPVEKLMELQPIGPVVWIDTAGLDDTGPLGALRIEKTRQAYDRADVGLLITEGAWGEVEEDVLTALGARGVPVVVVFTKIDLSPPEPARLAALSARGVPCVGTSSVARQGLDALRAALVSVLPDDWLDAPTILGDLVPPGGTVVMVVPIDKEAPKGRLILPQVQCLRDALDHDALSLVVKEHELRAALDLLRAPPALVVTDSQAFLKVAADVPTAVPMTSFSILFARYKGDLAEFVRGARAIDRLRSGDRVLIAEACTHHPVGEDIGRVKIPRWLTQYVGGKLEIDVRAGADFPEDLTPYRLVVQCGGCVRTRREMLSRILRCRQAGVPITNYGVAIAWSLGIAPRALAPFPEAALLSD